MNPPQCREKPSAPLLCGFPQQFMGTPDHSYEAILSLSQEDIIPSCAQVALWRGWGGGYLQEQVNNHLWKSYSDTALYQALGQITNERYHSFVHVVNKHSLSTYYVPYSLVLDFTVYS